VTDSQLLNQYLVAIGKDGEDNDSKARLARGQFHDVVLLDEVAYRFPRDEESRRLLPARAELLGQSREQPASGCDPAAVVKAALSQPLGRCHVAFRRLSGLPIEQIADPPAEHAAVSCLAQILDRLSELVPRQAMPAVSCST
jgi:hypothetical protein